MDYRAVKVAVEDGFGVDFDRARWAELFESDEPTAVNTAAPVISGFERIVNSLVEAARSGLVASGIARPAGTMESVRNDLELVRNDGGLTDGQLELLVDLTRFRNELQHDYIEVSADDAREAVRKLLSNAPKLTRSLNAWLARYDVGV